MKVLSQAYTPGLKRKEWCILRKSRILPIPGEVCVKKGDQVSLKTTVARTKIPGDSYMVKVASILGVDAEEIDSYMVKKIGEEVRKDETIARYKALFGMINTVCASPVEGSIESISAVTGQVIVREPPTLIEMDAYIPGTIVDILPNEGVTIETPAALIQGSFGIGGETHGELLIISKTPADVLTDDLVPSGCEGKILVGGSLVTGKALKKATGQGAKGIIVGGITDKDLTEFLGYRIGVAITGQEMTGLTVIATEGFGRMNMLEKTFRIFQRSEGKVACINGATQIRAGVIRPEAIIPADNSGQASIRPEDDQYDVTSGLGPGTLVRIIQEPYFGAVGKVYSLPVELGLIESESHVRIVEVELESKQKVTVPRANVEIVEE